MVKLPYFDYCALIVFAILLASILLRKLTKGRQNRTFIMMIGICILTTLIELRAVELDLFRSQYITARYVFHAIYIFLHSLLAPVYIWYLVIQTDTLHRFKQSRMQQIALIFPIVIVAILLTVNGVWNGVFYMDENATYTRGHAILILYGIALFYVVYGSCYLYKYRKTLAKNLFWALMSMFPIMALVAGIQFLSKNLLLEMFANACGFLFVSILVLRPEERIDSETGLEKLSAYVADLRRTFNIGKPIEIIMVNIVNYNSIHDMLGYDETVHLKRIIVDKMNELNREYKLKADLYYLGNGKFRFVVSGHSDMTETVAQQMNRFMKESIQLMQMDIHMVSCICITRCPEDIDDIDALLAFGNDLNTKHYSGDVIYASQQYKKEYYDIMKDIDRIIESALANHKFSVYYQPIFSVKEGRFRTAEALLRLKDEKYGFISPELFITAAEKSGAIYKIGEFVLEEVCRFISSDGFADLGIDYIEINLSVVQCMQNNLANQVLDILKKYKVRPEQINLEITETAASYSQKTMLENLSKLSDAGIHFSLDDFGTGYSNMRRIASLPLCIVKLDKSFTDVESNPRMLIILQNTIKMIKAMNMQIVVEGVETENVVQQFSDLQCEYIQGYYYSRPVPQNEFVDFIKNSMAG